MEIAQNVWRKPNSQLQNKNLVATVKNGGSEVMLWCSASGAGTMEFIDTIMTKESYLDILRRNLRQEKLQLPPVYWFQQDNDPKHTAHIVREWLLYNAPMQLKTPPQSPDMNPIEHLWGEIKSNLRNVHPRSKTVLKREIRKIWE